MPRSGKAHSEERDPAKIISFSNKSSKAISGLVFLAIPVEKSTTTSGAASYNG
jgi:hypothetical protein